MGMEKDSSETAVIVDGEQTETSAEVSKGSDRQCYNWLDTYMQFNEDWEPPQIFSKWTGLFVLSAVTGRKIWLRDANQKIYPNLYVVLVAPSGVGKTSAMREGRRFIESTGIRFSPAKVTAAKLIESIAEAGTLHSGNECATPYVIWAEEFPSFLGSDAYKTGMIADLTTLYDCPDLFEKETKSSGCNTINGAYVCLMAGSTASGLFDVLPPGSAAMGFTARIIFVPAYYPNRRVIERPWNQKHEDCFNSLNTDIKVIAKLTGPMEMSPTARVLWTDYYSYRPLPAEEYGDPRLQGYAARKPFYAKKLAMLLSLAENSSMVVDANHLEKALQLIEEVDTTIHQIYSEIAPSVIINAYPKIMSTMRQLGNGWLKHSELLKRFSYFLNAKEFAMAVDGLREMELIEAEEKPVKLMSGKIVQGKYYRITGKAKKGEW